MFRIGGIGIRSYGMSSLDKMFWFVLVRGFVVGIGLFCWGGGFGMVVYIDLWV